MYNKINYGSPEWNKANKLLSDSHKVTVTKDDVLFVYKHPINLVKTELYYLIYDKDGNFKSYLCMDDAIKSMLKFNNTMRNSVLSTGWFGSSI